MDYTFYMLPLSVFKDAVYGSDDEGSFVELFGRKMRRFHIVGSIAAMEMNSESGSGYIIVDDTFSSVLVHFQSSMFRTVENLQKGDLVEVLGDVDTYNESITLSMQNIRGIDLSRYSFNKLESIKNLQAISK